MADEVRVDIGGGVEKRAMYVVDLGSGGGTPSDPSETNITQIGSADLVADNAAIGSEKAILIAGKITTTPDATYANGDKAYLQLDTNGLARVKNHYRTGAVQLGLTAAPGWAQAPTDADNGSLRTRATLNYIYTGTTQEPATCPNAVARLISAANTVNATLVKNAAGRIHALIGYNAGTATYLKIYNKASSPTVGTDTPVLTIYLPANTAFDISFEDGGLYLGTGIGFGLTTGGADADTGAVASAAVLGLNIAYS